jgi:hypothetical protein
VILVKQARLLSVFIVCVDMLSVRRLKIPMGIDGVAFGPFFALNDAFFSMYILYRHFLMVFDIRGSSEVRLAQTKFFVNAQFGSLLPFVLKESDGYLLDSAYWRRLRNFVQAA